MYLVFCCPGNNIWLIDWLIDCCLTSGGKYYMHIQNEIKFNNIKNYIQKWRRNGKNGTTLYCNWKVWTARENRGVVFYTNYNVPTLFCIMYKSSVTRYGYTLSGFQTTTPFREDTPYQPGEMLGISTILRENNIK